MNSLRRSVAWSAGEKYLTMVVQFFSSVVIARLLTPTEIGIFSVGAVLVGFAHMLRDFGITNYVVQEPELTPKRVQTAFTVTLLVAWPMAAILWFISDAAGIFYQDPAVTLVIQVLAVNFLLIPFSSVTIALLRRHMQFQPLFVINFSSALVHALLAIGLAWGGFGFISLAWSAVAGTLTTVLLGIYWRTPESRFWPGISELKRILKFGSFSSLAGLVQEGGLASADLALGRLQNFAAVGFYSKGLATVNLVNTLVTNAISPVMLPLFAKINREGQNFQPVCLQFYRYYTVIMWPCLALIAWLAWPIVHLLYGDQWHDSVTVVQILALAFALRVMLTLQPWLLIAKGKVQQNFIIQCVVQIPRVGLTIFAAWYGGLYWVAWVQVIFYAASFGVYHYATRHHTQITIRQIALGCWPSVWVTGLTLLPVMILTGHEPTTSLLVLLGLGLLSAMTWLAALFISRHPLRFELMQLIKSVKHYLLKS